MAKKATTKTKPNVKVVKDIKSLVHSDEFTELQEKLEAGIHEVYAQTKVKNVTMPYNQSQYTKKAYDKLKLLSRWMKYLQSLDVEVTENGKG